MILLSLTSNMDMGVFSLLFAHTSFITKLWGAFINSWYALTVNKTPHKQSALSILLPFLIPRSCVSFFCIKNHGLKWVYSWLLGSWFWDYVWAYSDEIAHCYRWALQLLHLKPVPGYCSRRTRAAQYTLTFNAVACIYLPWLSFLLSTVN